MESAATKENNLMSAWESVGADNKEILNPVLMGDYIYYWNGEWSPEDRRWENSAVYRKKGGEETAREVISLGNKQLIYFLADERHNVYCLYGEYTLDSIDFFIRKVTEEGVIAYDVPIVASEEVIQMLNNVSQGNYISMGVVNSRGEVGLCNQQGELYLFDGDGQFLCVGNAGWDMEAYQGVTWGLVNAGEDGVFTYALVEKKVLLRKINMVDGSLGDIITLEVDSKISMDIYSGYERGILISDSNSLWEYHISENEMVKLFDWDSKMLNLTGYTIYDVSFVQEDLYVLACRQEGPLSMVHVTYSEEPEKLAKQPVILGMIESGMSSLDILAEEFNKYNSNYQIEIKIYSDSEELYKDLLKGDGADIFELGIADKYILAGKGVLENLSPYFEGSEEVKELDLLPSVRNACYVDGKLVFLIHSFYMSGYLVEQGITDQGGWTPEEFLALGEQYPDSRLLPLNLEPTTILYYTLLSDMDSFINWKDMKCYFNNGRFASLLERVVPLSDNQITDPVEYRLNAVSWLHDKSILTASFNITSVEGYIDYRDAYGSFAEFAGYPNQGKKPYYYMVPIDVLGLNSASEVKEGGWAFMEYLLSKENQNRNSRYFPVLKESFEENLKAEELILRAEANKSEGRQISYQNPYSLEITGKYPEITDTDRDFIRYMAENLYWNDTFQGMNISKIIFEEAGAFFAGDRSAEEAADIIQKRVSLLLNE